MHSHRRHAGCFACGSTDFARLSGGLWHCFLLLSGSDPNLGPLKLHFVGFTKLLLRGARPPSGGCRLDVAFPEKKQTNAQCRRFAPPFWGICLENGPRPPMDKGLKEAQAMRGRPSHLGLSQREMKGIRFSFWFPSKPTPRRVPPRKTSPCSFHNHGAAERRVWKTILRRPACPLPLLSAKVPVILISHSSRTGIQYVQ